MLILSNYFGNDVINNFLNSSLMNKIFVFFNDV